MIQLDESIKLVPNARRLVTVLEPADEIDTDWPDLGADALANAFGDDEPEYSLKRLHTNERRVTWKPPNAS